MRSLSPEQIVLFLLVIGLPLLKSIAGVIRKRNLSSPEADAAPRDNEQEPSWLRGDNEKLPWSRSTEEKPIPPAPPVTIRLALWEVPKVVAPLRHAVWQTPAASVERPVPPAPARKKQPQPPIARPLASSLLRQIQRDQAGQRRAIVLMAVFGPPRAIDPPP
jgi:hypothetical protein